MSQKRSKSAPQQNVPKVVLLAGPNGAGKTTGAQDILRGVLQVEEFVNADPIAAGLSGFAPERAARAAGRVMLSRIRELADRKASFGFESTLASRSFAPWLHRLVQAGYEFHLVFLWLPSPEVALARVAQRVSAGGHSVAGDVVRRRYRAGLKNFFELYQPLATTWQVIHNGCDPPSLVAGGSQTTVLVVRDPATWKAIEQSRPS